jgi:hypothetical protein
VVGLYSKRFYFDKGGHCSHISTLERVSKYKIYIDQGFLAHVVRYHQFSRSWGCSVSTAKLNLRLNKGNFVQLGLFKSQETRSHCNYTESKNIRILGSGIRGRFGKVRKVCLKIHALCRNLKQMEPNKSINDNRNMTLKTVTI